MRERIDQWCERGILGLVLAMIVAGPLATGAVRPIEFLVLQTLAIGIALLWVLRIWLQVDFRLLWPPVCWLAAAFVAYAAWRTGAARIEYLARGEWVRVVIYALIFWTTLNNLQKPEHINGIVVALLATGAFCSLYAIFQFVTGSDSVWQFTRPEQYAKRGSGTFISPNHLAGFLEILLPLGLAYTLIGRMGHLARVFAGYATCVCLAGIAVSISRGAWVATALALAAFFLVLLRKGDIRLPAMITLAVLLAAGALFFARTELSQDRFQKMFEDGKLENYRFKLWQPALAIWKESPWTGAGPAHFGARFRQYRPEKVQMRPDRVHNDYLNTLADWGVAGFILVLGFLIALVWGVIRSWKYARRGSDLGSTKSNRTAFLLGGSIGLLALALHSMVDFNMHIPSNAIVALVLMALLSTHWRHATERFWVPGTWPVRLGVSVVVVFATVWLGNQGGLRARELEPLRAADRAEIEATQLANQLTQNELADAELGRIRKRVEELRAAQLAALRRAWAIDPTNPETPYRIGEWHRLESWQGRSKYKQAAQEAIRWFDVAMQLNPFDPYPCLRKGMCLDKIGTIAAATPWFAQAEALDPNGYYTVAHLGWHQIYLGDYQRAREYFVRSLRLKPQERPEDNPIAAHYLAIVDRRLEEQARGELIAPPAATKPE